MPGTLELASISLSDAAATANYRETYDLDWPIWVAVRSELAGFPSTAVPATLVLDGEGTVVFVRVGVLTDADLDALPALALSVRAKDG